MLRAINQFGIHSSRLDHSELERRKWFIASRHQRKQREIHQDHAEDVLSDFAASFVLADPLETQAYKAELDEYDALTVEAIMENREVLDRLYAEREAMLERAYILEDGTRVFKSEDGLRVYNQDGELLPSSTVNPEQIGDKYQKAEPFFDNLKSINKHQQIEKNLLEFQEHLDEDRELADSGKMTKDELAERREERLKEMPIEVRRKLNGFDETQEQKLKSEFSTSAKPITENDMDMRIDPSMVPSL